MRLFYLIGAVISIVVILIVSFQNIQSVCTMVTVFFYELNTSISPTFLIFGVSIMGMVAGAFLFGFLHSLFSGSSSEEEDDGEF